MFIQFNSVTLQVAVETSSEHILEEKPVHLPEVLVCDDVYEHIACIHPPVPGVAHQVPEHTNLSKVYFLMKEKVNYQADLHAQLDKQERSSENGIGERKEHEHHLIL